MNNVAHKRKKCLNPQHVFFVLGHELDFYCVEKFGLVKFFLIFISFMKEFKSIFL